VLLCQRGLSALPQEVEDRPALRPAALADREHPLGEARAPSTGGAEGVFPPEDCPPHGPLSLVRSSAASTGSARVRGVMATVRGGFRCLLSVAIDDALADAARASGVRRLCVALGTRAFVSDGTSDPYSEVLIDETGGVQRALFDPDAEEREECRLWRGAHM